jgi:crotonobetaine/carnitine-CoA ligase
MGAAYEGEWVMSSIVDDRAERLGDRLAVVGTDGRSVTYGELRDRTQRIARLLLELGVEPGDRVATMLDPTSTHVEAAFGCAWAGAVEVPVNTDYKGLYLEHVLRQTETKVIVLEDRFVERLGRIELPDLRHVVVVGDAPAPAPPGVALHDLGDVDALAPAARVPRSEHDLYYILYTSGTTGTSKGAMHCNRSALWTPRVWVQHAELGEDDVAYSFLPLFHVTARMAALVACMLAGGSTVLRERFSVSEFWPDVRRYGATYTMYMGVVIHFLHQQEPREDDADNPLRVAGGAAAPPEIGEAFKRRFGCELLEVYGMTEIGTATGGWMGRGTPGSMGKPFDHLEIEIHDDRDNRVPPETPGEIVVRPREGDAIFQGYWRRPEETLAAFRNLWFHTGDLGKMTPLGEVVFLDRLKDSMRRRGENISSFEVERSVNAHPGVLETAAYPVPSEATEDEVMVAVVLHDGAGLGLEELLRFCAETMPRFAVPRYARVVEELPKTPTGRVQKHVLREQGVTADAADREALGIVVARG